MDPDAEPTTLIIKFAILFFLLACAAFFSAAETAFMSVDKFEVRKLIQSGNKKAKKVAKVLEDKDAMLSAILIGSNIVNIAASAFATMIVCDTWGDAYVSIGTAVLTIVVMFCCEIMPKSISGKYAAKTSMRFATILYVFVKVLTPVIFIVNLISGFFMKMFGVETKASDTVVTEGVIKTMLDMGLEDEQIEPEEHEIINNVLESNDACARDIMVPRSNVIGITEDVTYDELIATFKTERYSRLVVLDKEKAKVLGIVYMKDVFFIEAENFAIEKILRQPHFTYETKNIQELLQEMRTTSNAMSIVLDEYGEMAGILTIEDIVEEFVGQIRDEYDEEELAQIKKIAENVYEIEGSVSLKDINEAIDLNLQSENYNSIGGYIIEHFGAIPKTGQEIDCDQVCFEVIEAESNKVVTVRLRIEANKESVADKKNS
jgi:CBS domain containing-hemolysin-like protein